MVLGAKTSATASEAPSISEEIFERNHVAASSLNELLDHLLGGGTRILADAGLSRFCEQRLVMIQHGAEAQALESLHGLQALSRVLGVALRHSQDELPAAVLSDAAWHFHGQLRAIERWQELAANASVLRSNRRIAGDIARRYATWAHSIGEWPDGGD